MVTINNYDYDDEHNTEAYSESCQISKMECFAKLVNNF